LNGEVYVIIYKRVEGDNGMDFTSIFVKVYEEFDWCD